MKLVISTIVQFSDIDGTDPQIIHANFVEILPFGRSEQIFIDHFRKERPSPYSVGDMMRGIRIARWEGDYGAGVYITKNLIIVYLQPRKNAELKTIPAGTKIIFLFRQHGVDNFYMNPDDVDSVAYCYTDMDDQHWWPLIGADKRLLGWTEDWDAPLRQGIELIRDAFYE